MQLPDLKQLKEMLKILRSQGVLQYQSTDLNLVLSEHAPVTTKSKAQEIMDDAEEESPEAEYQRLLFYSADPTQDS